MSSWFYNNNNQQYYSYDPKKCEKCVYCNKDFEKLSYFKFHIKYQCEKYIESYNNIISANSAHKKIINNNYTINECSQCGSILTSAGRLKTHIKKKHVAPSNCGLNTIKSFIIGDIWNIICDYILVGEKSIKMACIKNDLEILNCVYIKNDFSLNNQRYLLPKYIAYMDKMHREKLLRTWVMSYNEYIPTKLEYHSIILSRSFNLAFIKKYILSNLYNNLEHEEMLIYIIEDIANNIIGSLYSKYSPKYSTFSFLKYMLCKYYEHINNKDEVKRILTPILDTEVNIDNENMSEMMIKKTFEESFGEYYKIQQYLRDFLSK